MARQSRVSRHVSQDGGRSDIWTSWGRMRPPQAALRLKWEVIIVKPRLRRGLRRRGFSPETIREIRRAFHVLFYSKLRFETALARVREEGMATAEVQRLVAFLEKSERGFTR